MNETSNMGINWPEFVQKASGNTALAKELFTDFIAELHHNKTDLSFYFHSKQLESIPPLIHKLKGSCCFFGVPALYQAVETLEQHLQEDLSSAHIEHALYDTIYQINRILHASPKQNNNVR